MKIEEKLDQLSELQSQADVIRLHFEELKAKILTPELLAALSDLDAEMNTSLESLQKGIDKLTEEITMSVLLNQKTAKGKYLMAVWSKPRVTWDTKGLIGYAVAHPEMEAFKKEGNPSVAIRKI